MNMLDVLPHEPWPPRLWRTPGMNPRLVSALTALLVLLCAVGTGRALAQVALQAPAGASSAAAKGGYPLEERRPPSPADAATLKQINAYRAQGANCGGLVMEPAEPLVWNDALGRAAQGHVQYLARIGDLTHTGADGSSVGQRMTAQGFVWSSAGENAAAGRDSMTATLAQWMGSAGHCRNMMGKHFREVAVARQDNSGSTYKYYWVMVLGTPMK